MFPGETVLSKLDLGEEVDTHVSPFQVMKSPAGWYVGTIYTFCECEDCKAYLCGIPLPFVEPNSRETDYFDSKEEAEQALLGYQETGQLTKQRY